MSKKVVILLVEGFEEIEAIVPIDVLRRLEFDLLLAGFANKVTGAHGVVFETDTLIEDLDISELSTVILPGGLPGATNLRDSQVVIDLLKKMNDDDKFIAAICAAPIVLSRAGLMKGKTCTGYPMALVKDALADANYTAAKVERDGNIITGKGPGAAFDFAFDIAVALGKEPQVRQLKKMMFVK